MGAGQELVTLATVLGLCFLLVLARFACTAGLGHSLGRITVSWRWPTSVSSPPCRPDISPQDLRPTSVSTSPCCPDVSPQDLGPASVSTSPCRPDVSPQDVGPASVSRLWPSFEVLEVLLLPLVSLLSPH